MKKRHTRTLEERFWSFVDRGDNAACWIWRGHVQEGRTKGGYGVLARSGTAAGMLRAHRVSWELHNQQAIPNGRCVMHLCDNRQCVNPAHLHLGTHAENMADMAAKGRSKPSRGVTHKLAKLKDRDIPVIRGLAANGVRQRDIAKQFGIHQSRVSVIVRGEGWPHLDRYGSA